MANTTSKTGLNDSRLEVLIADELNFMDKDTLTSYLGVKTITTKDTSVMQTDLSSPKRMELVPENGLSPSKDTIQGFTANVAWNHYHLAKEISHEAMKTDQSGKLKDLARDTADTVKRQQEYNFGRIFRQGFTSIFTGADGAPMISALHPLKSGGGVQANTFGTGTAQQALSYSSLLAATDIMNELKFHTGEKVVRNGKYILVVPKKGAIMETAFQLVIGNSRQLKPGTPNNDSNFFTEYEGATMDLVVSDTITSAIGGIEDPSGFSYSDTAWYLIDRSLLQKAFMKVVLEGSEIEMRKTEERNLSTVYDLHSFFGFGATSLAPLAIFGSKGDASTTNF
jgi:hypothetical protein